MNSLKLYMVLLGCKPQGRFIEQHDVFFGIASSLNDLVPQIKAFWPEAKDDIHIDAWREVNHVDGYVINISKVDPENVQENSSGGLKLFFLNLGGYKKEEFEEYHYRMLCVSLNSGVAVKDAKKTLFYKHTGFKGAASHVDDKYSLDVDDIYEVTSILPPSLKNYQILLSKSEDVLRDDPFHLGYLQLWKIPDNA